MFEELPDAAAVLAATGDDVWARSSVLRWADAPGWRLGGAVGWLGVDPEERRGYLSALGHPADVGRLVAAVTKAEQLPTTRASLPRGTPATLDGATDWDFRWTTSPPRCPGAGEELTRWLPPDAPGVADLLQVASDRPSVRPGDPAARRWAGLHKGDRLLACAADTTRVEGVGHVSSIAVHPAARRRGLGAALTGWLTRALLADHGLVTLGVYADNAVALAMYDGLGFHAEHRFTSGSLRPGARQDAAQQDAARADTAQAAGEAAA